MLKISKSLFVLFIVVALMLLVAACSDAGKKPKEDPKKADGASTETMTEFTEMTFNPGSFDNPGTCGGCHPDIYEAWSGSKHAVAWKDELFRADYNQAHQETDGATDEFCGGCHAPVALRTGQLPPHDGSNFDNTAKQGISCDFCHTVTKVVEPFNMRNISEPGKNKLGPRNDGNSPYHEVVYSELHTKSEFCGSCHTVIHPTTNVGLITTYDEWLETEFAEKDITCQKCHMTPTPGVGKNPGKSAPSGIERDSVATHYFVGGSSFSFKNIGSAVHAQKAEERLRSAAELKLEGKITEQGLELTTHVTNIGAGHNIPTGVSYIRKMWLEVTVIDENGKVIYESGHINEGNQVDPDAVFYRKLFEDAEGNVSGKSWTAESIAYDRRIAHNETDTETYLIDASGETFTANVRLMYRSFSQEALDQKNNITQQVESVEMAAAEIKL